jgi:uncharacterized protein
MRWTSGGRSANLEDFRGAPSGGRLPIGKLGLGGAVVLFLLSLVFGKDFLGQIGGTSTAPVESSAEQEQLVDFVSFVLDDVQSTWARQFQERGARYQDAKLVLFNGAVDSGCGYAESAVGPFYCPLDGKVYIDLGFYGDLKERFGAPGDFAQAYVIAHEIGHHVQNLLGISQRVQQAQQSRPDQRNVLSVATELQADCLAGVWAHSTARRDILERGDIQEGLGAAAAVGDDRLQRRSAGGVNPESFTHGSSEQRSRWFSRGFEQGTIEACDTFSGARL